MRTTFNRLRAVKDSLPHGSMDAIAAELGLTGDEVRAFFNGEGTGLGQAAATDRSDVPTYSTDGRRSHMPLKNLPAGVYIRGGKKVVK